MIFCFSASRLMKASEVLEICVEIRNNPKLLMELESVMKKELRQRFGQKEKAAS
jgi:hypothetical protein